MAGQDNLHIVREIFAAWNAHDVEGLVKRLDTKTTWKSDAFPAPFSNPPLLARSFLGAQGTIRGGWGAWRIVAPGTAPGLMFGTGRYRRWQSSWSR